MKNMIKLPAIVLGLMLLLVGTTKQAMAQNEDVSLQSFYDELSPYGTWIQDPQYGYVWRPDVDQEEFRPYYSNGRWAMTEYGNTWVSNYDWGWAPFHYGRWIYNSYNQWVWLPDTVWGPAWVSWRSGGGYYGWAPLGPSISIGINIGRNGYRVPDMCWNFIPYSNIYYSSYPRYYGGRNRVYIQNTVIINNTYVRNNRTYYTGPRIDDIRRHTNQNVTVYNVNRGGRPGASRIDNNNINIYSPRPSRDGNSSNPAPRNAVQGNISREPVGRTGNASASNRPDRTGNSFDRGNTAQGNHGNNGTVDRTTNGMDNRNNNSSTRPSRSGNEINSVPARENNSRVEATPPTTNGDVAGRPSVFGRNRESRETQPQKAERTQPTPSQPQAQPQQRVERQQPVQQQRESRPQPQAQPQRTERTQSAPPQRSSGGSESRSARGGSGGRPGRG